MKPTASHCMRISRLSLCTDNGFACFSEDHIRIAKTVDFEPVINTKFYADSLKICEAIQPCP